MRGNFSGRIASNCSATRIRQFVARSWSDQTFCANKVGLYTPTLCSASFHHVPEFRTGVSGLGRSCASTKSQVMLLSLREGGETWERASSIAQPLSGDRAGSWTAMAGSRGDRGGDWQIWERCPNSRTTSRRCRHYEHFSSRSNTGACLPAISST